MEVKEIMKETISKWNNAVEFHNSGKYLKAVDTYTEMKDISARMYYNLACAHRKLSNTEYAIECLSSAIQRDEHLAIAYFQRGTLLIQCKSIEKAATDLERARMLLRGNTYIDYKPLGLYVRLFSFQILHNLALALAADKNVVEARKLLTEALHDADDLQSKVLETSLERINDNRLDQISPLQISSDKVFTPPKHVTQNLEKKGIVRKAKVVSALNTEDRSPTFDGSKRVKELKEKLEPPKSPLIPTKRFETNKPTRNRSALDFNEVPAQSSMKKSKSMSDLLTIDRSNTMFGFKSTVIKIKRIFQKKRSDSTGCQVDTGLRMDRSFGDLIKPLSPATGKSSPRSPFTGVKKLLNNKRKGRNSVPSSPEEVPVLVMRGFGSTGDLRKLNKSSCSSEREERPSESPNILSKSTTDLYENLIFGSNEDKRSLGSVFGDYLTVTRLGLSLSCDVLTAIVTPTEDENDLGDDESLQDDAFNSNNDDPVLECGNAQTDHAYVNTRSQNKTEPRSTKPTIILTDKIEKQSTLQSDTKEKVLTQTQSTDFDTTANFSDQRTKTDVKKSRPPPPSYPPPPLPPKIVITI